MQPVITTRLYTENEFYRALQAGVLEFMDDSRQLAALSCVFQSSKHIRYLFRNCIRNISRLVAHNFPSKPLDADQQVQGCSQKPLVVGLTDLATMSDSGKEWFDDRIQSSEALRS